MAITRITLSITFQAIIRDRIPTYLEATNATPTSSLILGAMAAATLILEAITSPNHVHKFVGSLDIKPLTAFTG